jgi:hypothetical protein
METRNSQKKCIYECKKCNCITSNKSNYNIHTARLKHKNAINNESLEINGNEKLSVKFFHLYKFYVNF